MRTFICICLFLLVGRLSAQDVTSALLPMPNQVTLSKEKPFAVRHGKTAVYWNRPELEFAARSLQHILRDRMQVEIPSSESFVSYKKPPFVGRAVLSLLWRLTARFAS